MLLNQTDSELTAILGSIRKGYTIPIDRGPNPQPQKVIITPMEHIKEAEEILPLFVSGSMGDFLHMKPISGMTLLTVCSMLNDQSIAKAKSILNVDLEIKKAGGKKGNEVRNEKFNTLKLQMENYWKVNIRVTDTAGKSNNHIAKILMNTDIYKNSTTKPEQATIAGYVGEWRKELTV